MTIELVKIDNPKAPEVAAVRDILNDPGGLARRLDRARTKRHPCPLQQGRTAPGGGQYTGCLVLEYGLCHRVAGAATGSSDCEIPGQIGLDERTLDRIRAYRPPVREVGLPVAHAWAGGY